MQTCLDISFQPAVGWMSQGGSDAGQFPRDQLSVHHARTTAGLRWRGECVREGSVQDPPRPRGPRRRHQQRPSHPTGGAQGQQWVALDLRHRAEVAERPFAHSPRPCLLSKQTGCGASSFPKKFQKGSIKMFQLFVWQNCV